MVVLSRRGAYQVRGGLAEKVVEAWDKTEVEKKPGMLELGKLQDAL